MKTLMSHATIMGEPISWRIIMPKQCAVCGKPSDVSLQIIWKGRAETVDLCASCEARSRRELFSFADLFECETAAGKRFGDDAREAIDQEKLKTEKKRVREQRLGSGHIINPADSHSCYISVAKTSGPTCERLYREGLREGRQAHLLRLPCLQNRWQSFIRNVF